MKHRSSRLFLWLVTLPVLALACRVMVPGASTTVAPTVVPSPTIVVQKSTPSQPELVYVNSSDATLVDLYARVNPSVVNITVYATLEGELVPATQGSGFVYDSAGNVVTNAHVVHGAEQVDVTFSDGTIRPSELVGEDLNSDLAVVRVKELPQGIEGLPMGDMESLKVGQTVIAIGNPFGFNGTLTRGIISALGRTIPALTIFSIPQSIQTDAAINPGNSGGPLLNMNGEVIGVNAQIETDGTSRANSGVGFAIPVSILKRVVPELITNGKYVWSWVGVRGNSLTPTLIQAMDLPVEKGAYLWQISAGGPAEKAGLQGFSRTEVVNGRSVDVGGDVVTAIDGHPIYSFDDLLVYVALNTQPGQEITLTILRDGKTREVHLTLEPRPSSLDNQ